MRTFTLRKEDVKREWYVVDATGIPLGRLATRIATILRGKHKPEYTPHIDNGDFVICINADKVLLTGKKEEQKKYYRHSGYLGGLKVIPFRMMKEKKPEEIIYHAVRGMLPKNKLGRKMIKKLKVYAGDKHPHEAQKPKVLEIGG
ncbi:MAG TPA: 50S ribosomal protein L13 [candidate division WOR-3 bacterium]|uniref:Large ribosomal subunit protein uL13 n=1 Tax=candidate division WOR-3 bacterium TaxID=2052148 RepID=A0A7C0VC88_UNCW3|nr:50S ribosomal protein L13 [candidate division WOR-3 bacterium]